MLKTRKVVNSQDVDTVYEEAKKLVIETGQASVSMIQRRLGLGYTQAAKIIDKMEAENLVGAYRGAKPREILSGLKSKEQEKETPDGDALKETLIDVPLDAVGKAAESYLSALRQVEATKKYAGTEGAKLIKELKASGRVGIRIQGIFLSVKTIEASEKIVLKRD